MISTNFSISESLVNDEGVLSTQQAALKMSTAHSNQTVTALRETMSIQVIAVTEAHSIHSQTGCQQSQSLYEVLRAQNDEF
jgi:hypothetical protein